MGRLVFDKPDSQAYPGAAATQASNSTKIGTSSQPTYLRFTERELVVQRIGNGISGSQQEPDRERDDISAWGQIGHHKSRWCRGPERIRRDRPAEAG